MRAGHVSDARGRRSLPIVVALVLMAGSPSWGAAHGARLANDVIPERYALTLAPDLARGTFAGREAIDVEVARPTARITLDADGLAIVDARVVVGGKAHDVAVTVDDALETLTLTSDEPADADVVASRGGDVSRRHSDVGRPSPAASKAAARPTVRRAQRACVARALRARLQ